ncbi:MAG: RNA polymerase sigma factor, partial [Chitinophagaceae bacterium]
AAFVLQKLEGLRQDEIAAVLDTTVSSVESLLHRAKQNLRKELAGMMG